MTEYTVTGIRYQMGEDLSNEERTQRAERFLSQLKKGQRVVLMAEPDNPFDTNAIAVYIDYVRVGYISKEGTAQVHQLLDENHRAEGLVERHDSHVTFFISIVGDLEEQIQLASRPRQLPESPLGISVRIPFTKTESALSLIASDLLAMEPCPENMNSFVKLAELYLPCIKSSICYDDNLWLDRITKLLHNVCSQISELRQSAEEETKLKDIYNKVRSAVGDMHRTAEHWPERVFKEQLNSLRNDNRTHQFLYKKYCEAFLDGKNFPEADKGKMQKEYDRLMDWLRSLKWSELRNPHQLDEMALKVNYLGLSRQELYDLYSVVLLTEQLEKQLKGLIDKQKEIVCKLKPIFFGDEEEVNRFLLDIQGMKSKQITDRVNLLVKDNVISDLSRKRDLWKVLHDFGLYDKSESNWNSQVN